MSQYNSGNNYQRGSNAGGPPKRTAVRHALNDFAFRLTGQTRLEGAPRPPTLGFDIRRDGISFQAYTNVQGDDDNGRISAELALPDAMQFFMLLERAPRMSPGSHESIAVAQNEYNRQTNKREARPKMTLDVGKDDRGVIYVGISSWKRSRPQIRIEMLPSNFVRLVDAQGNPAPADKVSEYTSVAWAKSLSALVPISYALQYVAPPERNAQPGGDNQQRGGNGGYQQNRSNYNNQNSGGDRSDNNGGGGNAASNGGAFDDDYDLPL